MPILERLPHLHAARAWESDIPMESLNTAGVAGERWMRALQKEGIIYATRCDACGVTYVPARMYCERCFAALGDETWRPVGPEGTVESFTVMHIGPEGAPIAPRVFALVRLDGADTVLAHNLLITEPVLGQRVKAVFRPRRERAAAIGDIAGFEAVDE